MILGFLIFIFYFLTSSIVKRLALESIGAI